MIKMIFCSDINGGIGFDNDLIYNSKEDMKFFREMTTGHKVVMGYNTWVSLPKKPLPNRINYILCDRECDIEENENVKILRNLSELVELGKNEDIFVIGGAQLYNSVIYEDIVDEAYVTLVIDICHSADRFVHLYKMEENLTKRELLKSFKFAKHTYVLDAHIFKYTR